jgi:TetR/AcrR family transcriptional repressor of nem operon
VARSLPRPAAPAPGTADRILDVAEALVQNRGFNVTSYADISAAVGITTASLHYHFPTKADLGCALVKRYTAAFGRALVSVEAQRGDSRGRLEAYADLYVQVLAQDRICLCGMLAAEISTLPARMQAAVRGFFDANERWLAGVLDAGRRAGELAFEDTPRDAARAVTGTLEGAMLLARSYGEPERLVAAARRLIDGLRAPRRSSAQTGRRRTRG